jgi:hypothetical protein
MCWRSASSRSPTGKSVKLQPLERLNVALRSALGSAAVKRRTRVVGIYPNDALITRLVGAVLLGKMSICSSSAG